MITSLMALTAGELSVKITDVQTPIIIPFAPRYFGKTCLLHRLIRYIRNKGYVVNLDAFFLPPHIALNSDIMVEYTNSLCYTYSPCATEIPIFGSFYSFHCKRIVQFIDFPGDFSYNINRPSTPSALKEIIESPNKKIWLFMLELDGFGGQIERDNYSERIMEVAAHISPNDKIIIVVNKIDMCSMDFKSMNGIVQALYLQYPAVLNCFKNQNPVTKLWRPFNCDIVPFSAGDFCRTCDNKEIFQPGLDIFPKQLWKAICKGLS